MIPGHHLQLRMIARCRPYYRLSDTLSWIEGALHWGFIILWKDDRVENTPQNRIGTLLWRLYRCARIIFPRISHVGQMSPHEYIDLFADEVGHERGIAEGEVR
jgi:hypothetical protein